MVARSLFRLALASWLVAVACRTPPEASGGEGSSLDRLRSLPYVGSTPIRAGEGAGVVYRDERSAPGYNLYAVQMLARAELIDEAGNVKRIWRDPDGARWERAELLENGDLIAIGVDPVEGVDMTVTIPDNASYLMRFAWDGTLRWKRRIEAHHDVERTPHGRLMALMYERRPIPEVLSDLPVRDEFLTFLDEQGNPMQRRSLLDAIRAAPGVLPLQPVAPNPSWGVYAVDPLHANSLEWIRTRTRNPLLAPGRVLVSLRHQDAVVAIDWDSGKAVWAWGRGELLGPHDARLLDNGNLLVFDNGLGRGYSRVVEVDPVSGRIVWEYRADPPESFYTLSKGSSQRLTNGNTLIADSDRGRAFEVTPDGEIVWDFFCPHHASPGERAAIVRMVRYPPEFVDRLGFD